MVASHTFKKKCEVNPNKDRREKVETLGSTLAGSLILKLSKQDEVIFICLQVILAGQLVTPSHVLHIEFTIYADHNNSFPLRDSYLALVFSVLHIMSRVKIWSQFCTQQPVLNCRLC